MMVTTFLLVLGAMTMTWICDKISESGFGTILEIFSSVFVIIIIIFVLAFYFMI